MNNATNNVIGTNSNEGNNDDIVEELRWLYELSLSIGQTLDPHLTCRSFLKTLIARCDLTGVGIWWRTEESADSCGDDLLLLDAIPRSQVEQTRLPLSAPHWALRHDGQARVFAVGTAEFASLNPLATPQDASCALYPLGDNGVLLMLSASADIFSARMLGQIRNVATKLATTLEGCMAHARLRQSEAAQRARTDELAESRALLQTIIDTTPFRIFWKDRDSRYLGCNPAFARDAGKIHPAELTGKNDFDMAWRAQAELYQADDRTVIESGLPHLAYEEPQSTPDGKTIWLSSSKVPLRNSNQEIIGLLGVYEDITERKQTESRRKLLEYALNHVEEAAYLVNRHGQFDYVNDGAIRQLGYSREELLTMGVPDLDPDFPMKMWSTHWQEITEKGSVTLETTHRRKDGNFLPIEVSANYIAFEDQDYNLALVRDITKRKEMQQQLEEAKQAAEHLARTKSEFLANMSHEIRTPLSAVLGLARIGARENQGRKSGQTCQGILDAGHHLLDVINEILDYSKIEAGKMHVEARPFQLAKVLATASNFLFETARQKGLAFGAETAADLPVWVVGDALRLQQILINLLSNAFKFTSVGEVRLKVAREDNKVYFKVVDTGIGIATENLSRIFKPFEQADSSNTRRFGGTGLGLAISHNLAQLMGGDIGVESAPGAGSSFTLQLPLPETAAPTDILDDDNAAHEFARRLKGLRLLAAEDVEVNRFVLADLLAEAGASCVFADNGQRAIEYVQANPAAFDLVLMDVQMPLLDGYEATRRIRQIAPELPIIGLTAHALKEAHDKCLAVGMVDHVTKPLHPELLIAAILRWTEGGTTAAAVPLAPTFSMPPIQSSQPVQNGDIDWSGLEQRFKGKRAFIDKLLASILESHREFPSALRTAAARLDLPTVAAIAHRLRGSAGNIMATSLQEIATQTEAAARCEDEPLVAHLAEMMAAQLDMLITELETRLGPTPPPAAENVPTSEETE